MAARNASLSSASLFPCSLRLDLLRAHNCLCSCVRNRRRRRNCPYGCDVRSGLAGKVRPPDGNGRCRRADSPTCRRSGLWSCALRLDPVRIAARDGSIRRHRQVPCPMGTHRRSRRTSARCRLFRAGTASTGGTGSGSASRPGFALARINVIDAVRRARATARLGHRPAVWADFRTLVLFALGRGNRCRRTCRVVRADAVCRRPCIGERQLGRIRRFATAVVGKRCLDFKRQYLVFDSFDVRVFASVICARADAGEGTGERHVLWRRSQTFRQVSAGPCRDRARCWSPVTA